MSDSLRLHGRKNVTSAYITKRTIWITVRNEGVNQCTAILSRVRYSQIIICKGLLRHYWIKKDAKLIFNDALVLKKKKDTKKSLKQIFLYECTGNALKGYTLIILETWPGKGIHRQKVVQGDIVMLYSLCYVLIFYKNIYSCIFV